jgi:4-hydroxybenzoate polyprenyltransferase
MDRPGFKDILSTLRPYAELSRPYNSIAAILSFTIGYYFYYPQVSSGKVWIDFLLGTIVVVLLHSDYTMQNDLYDIEIDKFNKRTTPLINGTIKPVTLYRVIVYTVLAALFIASFSDNKIYGLCFVMFYSAFAIIYNGPPFLGSRRPSSILLLGFIYSTIPLWYGVTIGGNSITKAVLVVSLLHLLIRMSISILKDFKDTKGDRHYNKRTFFVTYGRNLTVNISVALALVGYLLIIYSLYKIKNPGTIVLTVLVITALINLVNRFRLIGQNSEKGLARIFQKSFLYQHLFDGAILLCLLTS